MSVTQTPKSPRRCGISRRRFCATAAVGSGLVVLGLGACETPNSRLSIGGDTSDDDAPNDPGDPGDPEPDLAHKSDLGTKADLSGPKPDLTQPQTNDCSGLVDCGAATAIASGSAKRFTDNNNYDFFVCRDDAGLYALSSLCPHDYRPVKKQTTRFYCPYHGATFDLNGEKPTKPAKKPLEHYALCVDASGNISVDYNTVVDSSTRT